MSDAKFVGHSHRVDWATYYMRLAETVGKQSTCKSNVGALIVNPNTHKVIGMGFNGAPIGLPHCLDVGCEERYNGALERFVCERTIHAEVNAVFDALTKSSNVDAPPLRGMACITTRKPCYECLKVLAQVGVQQIIYLDDYVDLRTPELEKRFQYIRLAEREIA